MRWRTILVHVRTKSRWPASSETDSARKSRIRSMASASDIRMLFGSPELCTEVCRGGTIRSDSCIAMRPRLQTEPAFRSGSGLRGMAHNVFDRGPPWWPTRIVVLGFRPSLPARSPRLHSESFGFRHDSPVRPRSLPWTGRSGRDRGPGEGADMPGESLESFLHALQFAEREWRLQGMVLIGQGPAGTRGGAGGPLRYRGADAKSRGRGACVPISGC